MAKVTKVTVAKKCPLGQHKMPDGKCMKDSAMKPKAAPMAGAFPGAAMPFKRSSGA